jgi:hypothetical protein
LPFAAFAANYQLNQWGANHGLYASLHSAYSATGANELTGGSPAYARQAVTWSAASGGSMSMSGTLTFNVPASTVAFIGFWDALTSGNFQGMFPDAASGNPFEFAVPSSTGVFLTPGSSYGANQTVTGFASAGATFPGGITAGTVYYVKSPATDSFSLSATSGGSALAISSDGSGVIQAIAVNVFASQGTFTVTSATVSIS